VSQQYRVWMSRYFWSSLLKVPATRETANHFAFAEATTEPHGQPPTHIPRLLVAETGPGARALPRVERRRAIVASRAQSLRDSAGMSNGRDVWPRKGAPRLQQRANFGRGVIAATRGGGRTSCTSSATPESVSAEFIWSLLRVAFSSTSASRGFRADPHRAFGCMPCARAASPEAALSGTDRARKCAERDQRCP
jgi:hypothetical protein